MTGKRGRPRLPSAVKRSRGTLRPHRERAYHELPAPVTITDPETAWPHYMTPRARKYWKRLVRECVALGVWADADVEAMRMICEALVDYEQAVVAVRKFGVLMDGPRGLIPNPAVRIKNDAHNLIIAGLRGFGFDPAARVKLVSVVDKSIAPAPVDEFDAFGTTVPTSTPTVQ